MNRSQPIKNGIDSTTHIVPAMDSYLITQL